MAAVRDTKGEVLRTMLMQARRPDNTLHRRSGRFYKYRQAYWVIVPAVIYFILFHYIPMYGVTLAFKNYQFDKGIFLSPWAGFKYFQAFFAYYNFWVIIRNTLLISFFKLVVYFPMPVMFALLINEIGNVRLKRFIQTASYLPNFISWVVVVIIFQQFLSMDGIVNQFRRLMGEETILFMSGSRYFLPIMFISFIWKNLGFNSILYVAALAGVDPGIYESAKIDGAGIWRQMWHVSLPAISRTAGILFILSLASVLSAGWDQIYLLRTPGNMSVADILDTYILDQGIKNGQFGYATAVSLFQSLIGLGLVLATNRFITKRMGEELL